MAIFVSYSHKDRDFVDRLCRNLLIEKVHVWMDRWELKPGDSLIDSVQNALTQSGAILVVLSKSSIESAWCKKEVAAGLIRELEGRGNLIIPILIEECEIPIFLKEKMYADFRGNWDEAYQLLLEALSKYTNLDQGRFDSPDFHVDYSSEYSTLGQDIKGLRYQFIEHAEGRPFSILSIVHINLDEKLQKRYMEYVAVGCEHIARSIITVMLLDFISTNQIKIFLKDAAPVYERVFVHDKKIDASLEIVLEVRWMGEDTGKTIVYWASESIKGALMDFMAKVKPLTPEEREKVFAIISRPV
ncbi:MAG: toll/interleukin-1 receptor domain-containing protein [Desulfobulbaceae bacterium]|nr:toll/interleukin-1 receptor domain-containing protein [Desulfobulbaceae bacterium]